MKLQLTQTLSLWIVLLALVTFLPAGSTLAAEGTCSAPWTSIPAKFQCDPEDPKECGGKEAEICGTDDPQGDLICGTDNQDVIWGGKGDDKIYGFDGKDDICGGPDNDTIYGGDGADNLVGSGGTDTCEGGNGPDTIRCENVTDP